MSSTASRPEWRDVNVALLAEKLQVAATSSPYYQSIDWDAVAEAAVDELIDRPEREFQAQLSALVARNEERDSVGSWAATASDWLPERSA